MSNMQQIYQCNGLMRYHSAPSSMLSNLIDVEEDLILTGDSTTFEETEFGQFLDDHLCNLASNCSVLESVSSGASDISQLPFLVDRESSTHHDDNAKLMPERESFIFEEAHMSTGSTTNALSPGPLSSIDLAHGLIESNLVASCGSAPMKLDAYVETGERNTSASSHLIRHNSSPVHIAWPSLLEENASLFKGLNTSQTVPLECGTSRTDIGMEYLLLPSDVAGTFNHVKPARRGADGREISQAQSMYALRPPIERNSGLLRQNSSPADFISHVSSDVTSPPTCTRVIMSENSLEEGRIGRGANQEAVIAVHTFGAQRSKHGRLQDFHNMHNTQSSESTSYMSGEASYYANVSSSKVTSTEVLCRVSAKRGCATHPRSIAERVRRTKINEGIKKLQELVPDMVKLTNTVTMLDEAVEYIKRLQQQVQELSACRRHCTSNICHSEGDIGVEE